MMEWEKQQIHEEMNTANNGMFVKVMTDDQMEVLRKQIVAYATICEQLVDLHKSLTSHHPDLPGFRLGNLYCDPLVTSAGHKIIGRQRWTPTPVQFQILESIFNQGNGTPSKQRIKEITSECSQHGHISETNVYNWFQNRRARSKRKQQVAASNNAESEVETEVESPNERKTMSEDSQSQHDPSPKTDDPWCSKMEPMCPSEGSSRPAGSLDQVSYGRIDHLIGKMEVPGSYNPYLQADHYNMTG